MKADHSLDCMGLYCPMPIVRANEKIKQIKTGEILELVGDDKGIKEDIPAWCEATEHEYLGMEETTDGEIKVYIKKSHD